MKKLFSCLFKSKVNSSCVLSSEDSLYKVTEQDITSFLEKYSFTTVEELSNHTHKIVVGYDLFGPWDLSLKEVVVSYIIWKRTGNIVY